jgi:hypothetical protein
MHTKRKISILTALKKVFVNEVTFMCNQLKKMVYANKISEKEKTSLIKELWKDRIIEKVMYEEYVTQKFPPDGAWYFCGDNQVRIDNITATIKRLKKINKKYLANDDK